MEKMVPINRILLTIVLLLSGINVSIYGQTKNTEENFNLGVEAMQGGDFGAAITCFESALSNMDKNSSDCGIVLFLLGTCYNIIEQPHKACALYERAIAVSKEDPMLLANVYPGLLKVYCNIGEKAKALSIAQQMEKLLREKKLEEDKDQYWEYAVALLDYYYSISDYKKGIAIGDFVQSIEIKTDELDDLDLRSMFISQNSFYMLLEDFYEKLGNEKKALESLIKSLDYIINETEHTRAVIYAGIANYYHKQNKNSEALEYLLKSLEIWDVFHEDDLETKAVILMQIGTIYANMSNPLAAIPYLEKAKDYYLKTNYTDHLLYTYSLLYTCYQTIGELDKSTIYADLLSTTIDRVKIWDDETFLKCYSTYSGLLKDQGKYKEAISAYNKLIEKELLLYGSNDIRLFSSYYNLASSYLSFGDIDNSLSVINKAYDLAYSFKDRKEDQAKAALFLVEIDEYKGNIGKAISDCENLKEHISQLSDSSNVKSDYYRILSELYGYLGSFDNFLEESLQKCEINLNTYGEKSPNYAISLLNLSEAYAVCDKREEALECNVMALGLLKDIYGKKSSLYHSALRKQGLHYWSYNPDKALDIISECMDLSKEIYGRKSNEYADDILLYYTTRIVQNKDNINPKDIEQYSKGLSIKKEIGKNNDTHYYNQLSWLATFYTLQKDYENRFAVEKELYDNVKDYVKENFERLIDWQRDALWNRLQSSVSHIPSGAVEVNIPTYCKLAYNCMLFKKVLLLTSNNSLTDLVRSSNNESLLAKHTEIQNLKVLLKNTKDHFVRNQMQEELNKLQREELEEIKSVGEFMDFIDRDWTDIKNDLKPGEAAIEFVSYPTQGCISYAAIVLANYSNCPQVFPLFNDKELEKCTLHDESQIEFDYANPEMFRIVWGILEKYALNGIKTIYFSPDGILHKIPMESLIDTDGVLASQKWNLYRVSSTREILKRDVDYNEYNAVLYGGINYDVNIDDMVEISRKTKTNFHVAQRNYDLSDLRSGVKFLNGTKEEIEDISAIMKGCRCNVISYSGGNATEESIYSLSDQSPQIIHFATHGFWWNEEKVESSSYFPISYEIERNSKDKSMQSSGLFLSGCNISLRGENLPDDIEDGILTASEIANLNLSNTDLIVLSACQSGLGKVSGEGVYGMQRGFKLAGVNSLLMSLWPVDDTATRLLMVEFYKHLLNGDSKMTSLLKAQEKVRSLKKFEAPKYWAGFILLDALN